MKVRYVSLAACLLGMASLAAAQDEPVVKIGSAAPTSGPIAHFGKENENGARLAVEDVNRAGLVIDGKKIRLELDAQDDGGDPRLGTQVAQRLVDDGVVAVVGHLNSGVSIVASRIYHDAQIAQISPNATNPQFTLQGYNTTYRLVATDALQAPVLANYATHTLKAKRFVVVDDATQYGQGLADQFEKTVRANGGEVLSHEKTTDKAVDFKAILTKIKAEHPDAVFYGGFDATGGPFARQARQLQVNARVLGADGLCSDEMAKLAGVAAENVVCSVAGQPTSRMARGSAFSDAYQKRFGVPVLIYAPYAYDAVMVIVDAMKRANSTDHRKILAELPSTNYVGLIGPIRFDAHGDVADPQLALYRFEGGKMALLDVVRP
jgi:branched-chain amino acid transport system substrate-binding protein